jgi:carboxypeptidase C (cathepsin A)
MIAVTVTVSGNKMIKTSLKTLALNGILLGALLITSLPTAMAQTRQLEAQSAVVTRHSATIKGKQFAYTATAGTQPVWDEKGEPIASLFYTYYTRDDVKNRETRPLIMSFNGGPGSASVWMHIAYTGPRILKVDDEGYPVQPYGIKDNPYSILDVADIVFINPVNTGYSRMLDGDENDDKDKKNKMSEEDKRKLFFGVNADIKYLAEWLNTFVTRNDRWLSPKYLIGESYGTTRVSGLALELQERQWMYLNGVILVSPTGLGILREGPVEAANRLPYFTAAAWYHNALDAELQSQDLTDILPEAEDFAINQLAPALAKGGFIDAAEKQQVAAKMALYSGLSEQAVLQNNLDVPNSFFWKELLRDKGVTIGRLDSRYLGIDGKDAGMSPDYNAELTSWLHSFTPAINYYLREELDYKTDIKYNMFGDVHPWDREDDHTGENLRQAMAENPYMKVMVQSGYYDGATNYFDAKYTLWQIDPSGRMQNRLRFEGYRSGHMMYLRREDLETANQDIRDFITSATPEKGEAARY